MNRHSLTLLIGLTSVGADSYAQCRSSPDSAESHTSIEDETIRLELISLIDWIWDHEGTGRKPELLELKGRSDCQTYAHFTGHGVDVHIRSAAFDSTKHDLAFDRNTSSFLCTIDGRRFLGTDGSVPSEQLDSLSVTIDSIRVNWPDSAWNDLYQPNFCHEPSTGGIGWECNVVRSEDLERLYIHMMNSDGAGGYAVVWLFINGRYVRRVTSAP